MTTICRCCEKEHSILSKPVELGPDELCDGCWALVSRVSSFMRLPRGKEYILALGRYGDEEAARRFAFLPLKKE